MNGPGARSAIRPRTMLLASSITALAASSFGLVMPAVAATPVVRLSSAEQALRRVPTERLAAELQRRGWIVVEP